MSKKENDLFSDALDKFWTIDEIVPKQKKNVVKIELSNQTVEINLDFEKQKDRDELQTKTYFIPPFKPKKPRKPEFEYDVQNSLIHHVTVYNIHEASDSDCDRFYEDAQRFCCMPGHPCEKVEFYSHSPQYTQLNKKQLNYYLYFRDCVRKGQYIETDYSYLILYIFELINLGPLLNINMSLNTIYDIWENYGEKHLFLSKLCVESLCDLALLNKINIMEVIDPCKLAKLLPNSFLKEFYFCTDLDKCKESALYLLESCSNYSYRKSKFATAENLPLYEAHILEALKYTLKKLSGNGFLSGAKLEDNTISRLTYIGYQCSPVNRKKIVVSLSSFSNSHELRFMITDIVKYSENKIRTVLGIKSKLTVTSLSAEVKKFIDDYFEQAIPTTEYQVTKAQVEEFDSNYDVAVGEISVTDALNIEKHSWRTADTLIDAFENDEADVLIVKESANKALVETQIDNSEHNNPYSAYSEFLDSVIEGDFTAERQYAQKNSKLLETVVDEINEIAIEHIGDVLLYQENNGYLIIDDYMEDFLNVYRRQ